MCFCLMVHFSHRIGGLDEPHKLRTCKALFNGGLDWARPLWDVSVLHEAGLQGRVDSPGAELVFPIFEEQW